MTDLDDVALPHAVALSWGVAEQPHKGPRRELSIERIVEAAIELADAEGIGAVSMNRVATSLGFTTMSLYRYITSKDDLLLLMQDAALDIPTPPEPRVSDWRAELHEWVTLTLAVFRAHPWYADIPIGGVPITPNNLRIVDWGLRCLRDTGLSDTEKMATILLATGYSRTFGTLERDIRQATAQAGPQAAVPGTNYGAALATLVTEERFPYLGPVFASGAYLDDLERDDDGFDDFEYGLQRILDGIAQHLQRRSEGTPDDPAPLDRATADRRDFYPKDEKVRAAAQARREAEQKLREALKREREALVAARARADKVAAKEAAAEEKRAAKRRDA
ncbi:TetR/AcrR family transcriptional regulator [Herbiconiux sp. CPCC 205763]|uniref:TetR/AcrR family transcriptional regulator n=1 Tax=Herbiconiux aconitum TaxID=2970913 RepID=A0ABT2GSH8_9MICO|nr:TetR/AcrR family transcriptional regulator [Herbiconiux aconitum]MCS5719180.1 TetR/AcrR family transcriptional regulator [Herbiconiux aconitum]